MDKGAPVTGVPTNLYDARQSLGPAKLEDLFPEGSAFRRSIQTFVALLALAGLIASFGLYQDSVASIIGAMVVAPLGGAIMAFAGALVTGRLRWQGITFVQVLLGALMVIAIGYAVSFVMPDPLTLTPALEARTHPGILDLGVALAAGAAGAYVTARRTGSDALPGVAIAVSLVPPLATVGICIELGRQSDAIGALLLFLTNFSAIVVVASIVFLLFGNAPSPEQLRERRRLRNGFLLALVALCVVSIPLIANGLVTIRTTILSTEGAPVVREWIGNRDLQVAAWSIEGQVVSLDLVGTEAPPPAADLATALAATFGQPVTVEVSYSPIQRENASAP